MTGKVFVSHASQDNMIAAEIALALRGAGFEVFFDESDLPPGGDYHGRIRTAFAESAYLVFLISPDSVTSGRYTMSELELAQEKWPHPRDRVLPVMLRQTLMAEIPPYLKAVTMLHLKGNPSAEVASALQNMASRLSESPTGSSSLIFEATSNALQAIHDLDNAIRTVLGPLSRFDHTCSDAKRQEIVASVEALADAERILPRMRQGLAQLAESASKARNLSPLQKETVDQVMACGNEALTLLGRSHVTPWPGPHELVVLLDGIRTARTPEAALSVREQANTVQSVVNRGRLHDADILIGRLRGTIGNHG